MDCSATGCLSLTEGMLNYQTSIRENAFQSSEVLKIRANNLILEDRELDTLLSRMSDIRELNLGDSSRESHAVRLAIDDYPGISDAGLSGIGNCHRLTKFILKIKCSLVTEKTYKKLAACTRLEKLTVRSCERYQPQTVERRVPEVGGLRECELIAISNLTALKKLDICLYKNSSGVLQKLTQLQKLQSLKIRNASSDYWRHEDNVVFEALSGLKSLTRLHLERMRNVSDRSLELLMVSLTHLDRLSLVDLDLGPSAFSFISKNCSLTNIQLIDLVFKKSQCRKSDLCKAWLETLPYLASCSSLKELTFSVCTTGFNCTDSDRLLKILETSQALETVVIMNLKDNHSNASQNFSFNEALGATGKYALLYQIGKKVGELQYPSVDCKYQRIGSTPFVLVNKRNSYTQVKNSDI